MKPPGQSDDPRLHWLPLLLLIALHLGGCAANRKGDGAPAPSTVNGNATSTALIGSDARWSEFGAYLEDFIGIVQSQWYKILAESRVSPPRATSVTVKFRLNSQGEVEIIQVEDHGAGKQGVFACVNAITYPMPYPKWTDQMTAALGNSQELTFSFHYQ